MTCNGYNLLSEQEISELKTKALLYRHKKTGAEILSLINGDENKVFGITFRTPPGNATGVAHILEHSVLCGSKKYPVKEPFVELMKSSLQTFLNAMTFPDKTCYPVASLNLRDFYNLINVYLDAVFSPLITEYIFQQEGWHYELEKEKSRLNYKGVVFNEMKGAYSSPAGLLLEYSQQSLFPDNTYAYDAGGKPAVIPELSYTEFIEFHKKYYHPSNSKIFFYGDDDPEERLRIVDKYLNDFDHKEISSSIAPQPFFNKPVRIEKTYCGSDTESDKYMITVNWLFSETTDAELNFTLQIIEYILIGMPASPLRKALIDSGLGEDIAGAGLENELRQMYFSIGMKAVNRENTDAVEKLIIDTLKAIVRDGIDKFTIEAAFNTIEFRLRENNTGNYPRGLIVMFRSLTTWLHDADPLILICFEKYIQNIKNKYISDENFFTEIIDRLFLNNNHRSTVILKPDCPGAGTGLEEETKFLEEKIKNMSPDEITRIIQDNTVLLSMQQSPDSPEALSTIPALSISDIERKNKIIPVVNSIGEKIFYHDLFTNGIVYLEVGFSLLSLPPEYLPYVQIFGKLLLGIGTEKEDFAVFSQRISRYTGGIGHSSYASIVRNTEDITAWIFLRCKVMTARLEDLIGILIDMLTRVKLDNRVRFKQILLEARARMEQALIPEGSRFVNIRMRSCYNKSDWASEQMNGVSYLFFLRDLTERVEKKWEGVLNDLKKVQRLLINSCSLIINITAEQKDWDDIKPLINSFHESLPVLNSETPAWQSGNKIEFEGLTIPAQVNYVGKSIDLYRHGYRFHGSIYVITRFLKTGFLWDRIRIRGGAYGIMCNFDMMSGVLTLVSYRDPNSFRTIEIYDEISAFLKTVNISNDELKKNIIGTIGDIDSYMLPDAKGYTSMLRILNGNTDEVRQKMRDEIFDTSVKHFHKFGEVMDGLRTDGIIKILGSDKTICEILDKRKDWKNKIKVL